MSNPIISGFDVWVHALGLKAKGRVDNIENISLEGIASLRKLILDLAIQGKLTTQDSKDEPATKLLERITKEKNKLIPSGKQVTESIIASNEKPFQLPNGWTWSRLVSLGTTQTGSTPKTTILEYFDGGEIPFIGPGQINKNGSIQETDKFLTELSSKFSSSAENGDIVMVCIGGSIGKCAIVKSKITFNQQLNSIRPLLVKSTYLYLALNSNLFQNLILEKSTGSATPIINRSKWECIAVPLPPIEEQSRIVAKVDELMNLCDKLEKEQFSNLKTHQVLVKTLLETLTQAADANELQSAWVRMSTHFDVLFCTEDSIEQLKQTILQLAVMGKLVKQEPNDEPAGELLKKINIEKLHLNDKGIIKDEKKLPPIESKEIPFSIPTSWSWCRIADISILINGDRGKNYPSKEHYVESGIPFITAANLGERFLKYDSLNYITEDRYSLLRSGQIEANDILYCLRGSLGKCAIVDRIDKGAIASSLCIVRPFSGISYNFLLNYFLSPLGNDLVRKHDNGTAQPNLSATDVKTFIIPLPPIAEQNRIVARVEELFTLCDSLKEKLQTSQDFKVLLSKTIVKQAVQCVF
ncbi:MAG TPA: restriction endonuclease subunit S [Ignavibacteria bacterium]|nr:restriction endonuclease subunit S [Ignavibacteria bacterium]HMQ98103.1 restriction endonuclease subunit S [Ignavibacteria bacterium]